MSRYGDRGGFSRPAFSLAELVVAIGILVLMLSLAGQVFTITVQSTGKATALTEVSQQLRLFEETLRADLAAVDPQRTLLVIQGNPVNAFWTQDNLEAGAAIATSGPGNPSAGYPHAKDPDREDVSGNLIKPRADILFFYTARPAASALDPRVTSNLQQVVYGHAELGEYASVTGGGDPWQFNVLSGDPNAPAYFPVSSISGISYPNPTGPSLIPAQQWHLARRSTLFVPTGKPDGAIEPPLFGPGPAALNRAKLLRGMADVITLQNAASGFRIPFECLAVNPSCQNYQGAPPYFLPYILSVPGQEPFLRSWLDTTPPPLLMNDADGSGNYASQFYGLGHYMLPNCASFKVEWALDPRSPFVNGRLDGLTETLWFDPGDEGNGGADPADPLRSLQDKLDALEVEIAATPNPQKGILQSVQAQLRSLLKERVCLINAPQFQYLCEATPCSSDLAQLGMQFSLEDRFRGQSFPDAEPACAWVASTLELDRRHNMAIFTASRPALRGDLNLNDSPDEDDLDFTNTIPDPIFPGALRITIDVFDNRARLDRPIRHVMVIPIGS